MKQVESERPETQGIPTKPIDANDNLRWQAYEDRLKCQMLPVDKRTLVVQCGNFCYLYPATRFSNGR